MQQKYFSSMYVTMKCIKNRMFFFRKRPTGQGHRGVQIPKNKEFKSPKINTKFHFSDKTKTKNIILTNYLATVTVTLVVHKKRDFFFKSVRAAKDIGGFSNPRTLMPSCPMAQCENKGEIIPNYLVNLHFFCYTYVRFYGAF